MREKGIVIQPLKQKISRNEEKCVHCGVCVVVCPTGALVMDVETMKVEFVEDACIACEHCIPACPLRAMETQF